MEVLLGFVDFVVLQGFQVDLPPVDSARAAHHEPRPAPSQYTGHSVGQRGATSGTLLVVVMVAALTILDADVLMWWTEAERTTRRTNSSSRASSSVGVRWGIGLGEPVETEAADEAGVLLGVHGV